MQKIEVTTDYSIFKKHECNRPLDMSNLRKIELSIKTNNMLALRPVLVDEEMRVIDGQHRLKAAENLGVAIYYQVNQNSKSEDIILLNANQKRWSIEHYIHYYAVQGNKEYLRLQKFCSEHELTYHSLFSIFRANARIYTKVRAGTFVFKDQFDETSVKAALTLLEEVMDCIERYRLTNNHFIKGNKFKTGLLAFLLNKDIDMSVFLNKLSIKVSSIKPCANIDDYIIMFSDIYNWKNRNPV